MTTVCFRLSETFLAMIRAAVSAPPPATKPTTSVIVFCGSSCAPATVAARHQASRSEKRFMPTRGSEAAVETERERALHLEQRRRRRALAGVVDGAFEVALGEDAELQSRGAGAGQDVDR